MAATSVKLPPGVFPRRGVVEALEAAEVAMGRAKERLDSEAAAHHATQLAALQQMNLGQRPQRFYLSDKTPHMPDELGVPRAKEQAAKERARTMPGQSQSAGMRSSGGAAAAPSLRRLRGRGTRLATAGALVQKSLDIAGKTLAAYGIFAPQTEHSTIVRFSDLIEQAEKEAKQAAEPKSSRRKSSSSADAAAASDAPPTTPRIPAPLPVAPEVGLFPLSIIASGPVQYAAAMAQVSSYVARRRDVPQATQLVAEKAKKGNKRTASSAALDEEPAEKRARKDRSGAKSVTARLTTLGRIEAGQIGQDDEEDDEIPREKGSGSESESESSTHTERDTDDESLDDDDYGKNWEDEDIVDAEMEGGDNDDAVFD